MLKNVTNIVVVMKLIEEILRFDMCHVQKVNQVLASWANPTTHNRHGQPYSQLGQHFSHLGQPYS